MKLSRTLGACVLAVAALSAVVASGASAALPELGRCVAVPKGTGSFVGKNCQKASPTNKGAYKWEAGAAKKKFEGSSETVLLETAKLKISCAAATLNGEYTGAKTSAVTVDLIGCLNVATKHKCNSNPVKEGEIETPEPLKGELGFITGGEKPTVGLDLSHENLLVAFTCGEPGTPPELQGTLEGSVIAPITKTGVMTPEFSLLYKAAGGKQIPEKFEGGPVDTLTLKVLTSGGSTTETAVLKTKATLPNEEPLEIKTK
jgi:hypothetical protein